MTYSIVARDPATGLMGIAVQSHHFAVGAHVLAAEPGVGVMAVQSFADRRYVAEGMAELFDSYARSALEAILARHPKGQRRAQVALLPSEGELAVHTGELCVEHAGQKIGNDVAAQANMVASPDVWPSMVDAFMTTDGELDHRLLAALHAGEQRGGDWRGKQSAALMIVPISVGDGRSHVIDIRVDDHPRPLAELDRLNGLRRAALVMEEAIGQAVRGDVDRALDMLTAAQREFGDGNREPDFWAAVVELRNGRYADAEQRLRSVREADERWIEFLRRLPGAELLDLSPSDLAQLEGRIDA